jgi:hypothetical protein
LNLHNKTFVEDIYGQLHATVSGFRSQQQKNPNLYNTFKKAQLKFVLDAQSNESPL